jgi:hypothetical protein
VTPNTALDAGVVRVGRAVEALQLVGELPAELQMERPLPRPGRSRQEQVRAFALWVQADRRDLERPAGSLEPPGSELQVDRVQHDLVERFHDLQRHGLGAGERRRLQIGFEEQVVAMGGDGAGQAVASLVIVDALSDRGLVGHALSRSRR